MKKRVISILCMIAVLTTLFAGCGSQKDDASQEAGKKIATKSDSQDNEEIELTCYLENWGTDNGSIKQVMEAFQKDYPHIKLNIQETPDYETKVGILMTSGETIDVLAIKNPIQFTKWASAGSLLPLDDLAKASGFDYAEAFGDNKKAAMYDEHYYMLPWQKTYWLLTYNKQLFDDAGLEYPSATEPMTWDEYREVAKKLTQGEGQDKKYGALNLLWPMYWYGSAIQTLGGGEMFYNEAGLSNIEDPAFSESLRLSYDMQHVDESVPTYADVKTQKINAPAFMSGNYGMYVHGSWIFGWLKDSEKYPRDWKAGIAPLPVPNNSDDTYTWGVYGGLAISKTAKYPEEAFTFIKYASEMAPELSSADLYAHNKAVDFELDKQMAAGLEEDGITSDMVKHLLFNQDMKFVTEKITGKNSVKYEAIAKEEVEKYFVDIQDLPTTIANIKERANKVIQED